MVRLAGYSSLLTVMPAATATATATAKATSCPICRTGVEPRHAFLCSRCGVLSHLDCRAFVGRCAIYGCEPAVWSRLERPVDAPEVAPPVIERRSRPRMPPLTGAELFALHFVLNMACGFCILCLSGHPVLGAVMVIGDLIWAILLWICSA